MTAQVVTTVLVGVATSALTAILAYVVRISRQLTRVVQYFDSTSPVSEAMGGTLPQRLKKAEDKIDEHGTKLEAVA